MRAIDTNVLVRLVTRDDARQVAAAEAFMGNGAWISHLALAEATSVLASVYDLEASAIATAVETLLHHRALVLEEPEVVSNALQPLDIADGARLSDPLLLELAGKPRLARG